MLKFLNSLHLRLFFYDLRFVLHILSLSFLLIINQFVHKLFCLNLLRQESWVVLFRSHCLYFVLLHHLLNLSLVLHSFKLLSLLNLLLFMLWRQEILLEMFLKDFWLLVICSFKSSLVSLKFNVFSANIFWDLRDLIRVKHNTFISISVRILFFYLHLFLLETMREVNRSSQSISFFWAQSISVFWRNWVRDLHLRYKVLSELGCFTWQWSISFSRLLFYHFIHDFLLSSILILFYNLFF